MRADWWRHVSNTPPDTSGRRLVNKRRRRYWGSWNRTLSGSLHHHNQLFLLLADFLWWLQGHFKRVVVLVWKLRDTVKLHPGRSRNSTLCHPLLTCWRLSHRALSRPNSLSPFFISLVSLFSCTHGDEGEMRWIWVVNERVMRVLQCSASEL